MKAVMERQSRTVLKQIAAGVEYDDATSTFTYIHPDFDDFDPNKHGEVPPPKPKEEPTEKNTEPSETKTEPSTAEETTEPTENAAQEQTDRPSESVTENQPPPDTTVRTTAPPTESNTATTTTATTSAEENFPVSSTFPPEQIPPGSGWGPPEDENHQRPDRPHDEWNGNGDAPFYPPQYDWKPWWDDDDGDYYDDDDDDDGYNGTVYSETNCGGRIIPLGNITTTAPLKEEKEYSETEKKWEPSDIRPGAEAVPKSLGSIDFFIVMADTQGRYLATLNNEDLAEDTAQSYITSILNSGTETGTISNFQFYQLPKENGTLMVFTDKRAELDMLNKLIRTTIVIGIAAFFILSVAAYFLSRQVMKPLKTAFEKQKQFISDASHELKTPVTVISANADVLSDEIGENKWLTYIKSQTERMNILVNDLLNLTRLENNTADFIKTDFNLSKAVVNTALPFECQAFETNKKFELDIEEGISVNGSERHIKQMTAIFIDNALKYSGDGGIVRVTLKKSGDKRFLSIYNTGTGVKDSEKDKIFERFYRSDESRNRATGGYGLGLAIAKSIIDRHKFKVTVENEEGKSICFIITM
jgi:histidine kinase